jgi:hypothetical protein
MTPNNSKPKPPPVESRWESPTRFIGRVDGFGGNGNAFAFEDKGWRDACHIDHGPRVVIAPVIAASMAA